MSLAEQQQLERIERKISDMRLEVNKSTNEMSVALAKLTQRLDGEVDPETEDHEDRLRRVERLVHFALGACGLMSALGLWQAIANALR